MSAAGCRFQFFFRPRPFVLYKNLYEMNFRSAFVGFNFRFAAAVYTAPTAAIYGFTVSPVLLKMP